MKPFFGKKMSCSSIAQACSGRTPISMSPKKKKFLILPKPAYASLVNQDVSQAHWKASVPLPMALFRCCNLGSLGSTQLEGCFHREVIRTYSDRIFSTNRKKKKKKDNSLIYKQGVWEQFVETTKTCFMPFWTAGSLSQRKDNTNFRACL